MKRHLKKFLICLAVLNWTLIPANAVFKGESAIGDVNVLTLATSKESRNQWCSMAMLSERIIVTAGHCMAGDQTQGGILRFQTSMLWVTQPGVDMSSDLTSTRVKVSKVILIPGYENYWLPEKNDRRTQRDDISFIFLEEPLKAGYSIPIANAEEIANLKRNGGQITHYGYGLQEDGKIDQKPYKLTLNVFNASDNYLDANKTIFTKEDGRALCPGDSGGPWYSTFNGVSKIVAVTVAAGGCRGNLNPQGTTLGTLIFPYLDLMKSEWEKFTIEEIAIKSARMAEEAKKILDAEEQAKKISVGKVEGTYVQDMAGCHALGVNAVLQRKTNSVWVDFEKVGGWVEGKNCPSTNPVQPWNILDLNSTAELRWRIWSPGSWEAFTPGFVWTPKAINDAASSPLPIATKAPIPTKTKSEFVSKAKKTIECLKGKTIKKISGLNPTCPNGYRLKK